jgi:hypothetical protein
MTHFKTTFKVLTTSPAFPLVKEWATPGTNEIVIDSYELTAQEADLRACRLFAKLGAIGCIASHTTAAA